MKKIFTSIILTLIFTAVCVTTSYSGTVPMPNGTYGFATSEGEPAVMTITGSILTMTVKGGGTHQFALKLDYEGNYYYFRRIGTTWIRVEFEGECTCSVESSDGSIFILYNVHPLCN